MLAVAPSTSSRDEKEGDGFSKNGGSADDFLNFSYDNNSMESIDFDDLFEGMEDEDHVLPEFSTISGGDESDMNARSDCCEEKIEGNSRNNEEEDEDRVSGSSCFINNITQGDDASNIVAKQVANKGAGKGRKSSKNNLQGKKKVKVDWTPDLHRRFVQAVEELGLDKAVPSRILEIMGIDGLTRHNIASHLQKYRSHCKHLLAREAEAGRWSQRRQAYGGVASTGGGCKKEMIMSSAWLVPIIGFPHIAPPPAHHHHHHHFVSRPLHVWGHPSVDQSLKHTWSKHILPPSKSSPSPLTRPPAAAPPPPEPSFWNPRHQNRYPSPAPVPGIPPHAMYKSDPTSIAAPPPRQTSCPISSFHSHPSMESIDAAIEDVLSQPWLPLPLGLKPPSTDSVVVELCRQGIEKIPPTCV